MESRQLGDPQSISQVTQQVFDPETRPTTPIPDEGNTSVFIKNFGKFERPGSTFMWKIFRPGREKLQGYSKPANMAEKANKQELLLDIIRRLGNNQYIREGIRIELFRNFSDDDKDSVKLVTLYGTRFLPEPVVITEGWLMKFLKNYYNPIIYNYGSEMFPTGDTATLPDGTVIIPDSKKQAPPKDPFDLTRYFKNEDALMNYIEKLQRENYPPDQIKEYFRQKVRYFHSRNA